MFMIFMMMFAIIPPAIIVGGIAERMKLIAFAIFIPLWTLAVYSPIVKWIWGNDPGQTGFFALGNEGALAFRRGDGDPSECRRRCPRGRTGAWATIQLRRWQE